jgi:alpha-2-macroglobulin
VYTLAGKPLSSDFKSAAVNDRFVVLLKVNANKASGRIQTMIKDPVPAGFQIESVITPSQRDDAYTWLPELPHIDVVQAQDDALFAADLRYWGGYRDSEMLVAYVLRATTLGKYMPVQAVAENMYAADVYGVSAAHSMEVKAK